MMIVFVVVRKFQITHDDNLHAYLSCKVPVCVPKAPSMHLPPQLVVQVWTIYARCALATISLVGRSRYAAALLSWPVPGLIPLLHYLHTAVYVNDLWTCPKEVAHPSVKGSRIFFGRKVGKSLPIWLQVVESHNSIYLYCWHVGECYCCNTLFTKRLVIGSWMECIHHSFCHLTIQTQWRGEEKRRAEE